MFKILLAIGFMLTSISCARMTSYKPGKDGAPGAQGPAGANGSNGQDGANGTPCTVAQTDDGAVITCGDTVSVIGNGKTPTLTYLCHVPPGNPDKARTLYVPDAALAGHLGHGDYEGECQ